MTRKMDKKLLEVRGLIFNDAWIKKVPHSEFDPVEIYFL